MLGFVSKKQIKVVDWRGGNSCVPEISLA